MINIRPARLTDLPYLYEICLFTSAAANSPDTMLHDLFMVGHYYAAPYLYFEDGISFVLTDNDAPVGYILGTSDSAKYYEWLNNKWLPDLRLLYKHNMTTLSEFENWLLTLIHEDAALDEFLAPYPAHLHIDILPAYHGKGYGKKLMEHFFEACKEKECTGVHFGVDEKNDAARQFYLKTGMRVIREQPGIVYMGKILDEGRGRK